MPSWIEDTHGLIKLPTPGGSGYGAERRANISLGDGFRAQAHGPQQISGLAIGLRPVADAMDKWAAVLAQQEERAQKADALREALNFQDDERQMQARMTEMKSRDGYENAVRFAEEFYKARGAKLMKTARSNFQRDFLEAFFSRRRAAGLDLAFVHRAHQLSVYEGENWERSLGHTLAIVESDPENWRNHTEAMNSLHDALSQGEDTELTGARRRIIETVGLEAAVMALAGKKDTAAARRLMEGQGDMFPEVKERLLAELQVMEAQAKSTEIPFLMKVD